MTPSAKRRRMSQDQQQNMDNIEITPPTNQVSTDPFSMDASTNVDDSDLYADDPNPTKDADPNINNNTTTETNKYALVVTDGVTIDKTEPTAQSPQARLPPNGLSLYYQKSDTGFVGLSNQGATCYLNSLVQTFYGIPELRRLIYSFKYDPQIHSSEESCIPLQLQKLFARLQLSERRYADTKNLTRSFGWEDSEAFVQHDVQELCRVLLDALDKSLEPQDATKIEKSAGAPAGEGDITTGNTDPKKPPTPASDLFTGKLEDYIKCVDPSVTKEVARKRIDDFQDVQLVIRDVGSLEEALRNFVKPELMNGDNQWFSEELNRKVDAEKGLKFAEFPYLLTFQLKRFDYDYTTWMRVKLANRVSFPFVLDVAEWAPATVDPTKTKYELFSVLIHSGSANAGHYYALVKNFADGRWYNFNDSNVSAITEDDVEKIAFGDDADKTSRISRNGYMLMYRLIDPSRNVNTVSPDEIPESLRAEVEQDNQAFQKEIADLIEAANYFTLQVHYEPPREQQQQLKLQQKQQQQQQAGRQDHKQQQQQEQEQQQQQQTSDESTSVDPRKPLQPHEVIVLEPRYVKVKKTATATEALDAAIKAWELDPNNFKYRLCEYEPYAKTVGRVYAPGKLARHNLEALRFLDYKTLILQSARPDDEFQERDYSYMVHISKFAEPDVFFPAVLMKVPHPNTTLAELKALIEPLVGIPAQFQRVVRAAYPNIAVILEGDDKRVRADLGVYPESWLYVERYDGSDKMETVPNGDSVREDGVGAASAPVMGPVDEAPKSRLITQLENWFQRVQVWFNTPEQPHLFEQSVFLDQRLPVRQLKEEISKRLQIPVDQFIIRRPVPMAGQKVGAQFKDENESIQNAGITANSRVLVERGSPLRLNEFRYKFYLFTLDGTLYHTAAIDEATEPKAPSADAATPGNNDGVVINAASLGSQNGTTITTTSTANDNAAESNTVNGDSQQAQQHQPQQQGNNPLMRQFFTREEMISRSPFTPLFEHVFDENTLLGDIKKVVIERLRDMQQRQQQEGGVPEAVARLDLSSTNNIRIREKFGIFHSGAVLWCDDASIKDNLVKIASWLEDGDDIELVVQYVGGEDPYSTMHREHKFQDGDTTIIVNRWYPSRWRFGTQPRELIFNKNTSNTTGDLKKKIAELLEMEAQSNPGAGSADDVVLAPANIALAKAPQGFRIWRVKEVADIPLLKWDASNDVIISGVHNAYNLQDGDIVFFKDIREPEKVPLQSLTKTSSIGAPKPKEKALKIKVNNQAQQQQQQQQQSANAAATTTTTTITTNGSSSSGSSSSSGTSSDATAPHRPTTTNAAVIMTK